MSPHKQIANLAEWIVIAGGFGLVFAGASGTVEDCMHGKFWHALLRGVVYGLAAGLCISALATLARAAENEDDFMADETTERYGIRNIDTGLWHEVEDPVMQVWVPWSVRRRLWNSGLYIDDRLKPVSGIKASEFWEFAAFRADEYEEIVARAVANKQAGAPVHSGQFTYSGPPKEQS